MYKHILKNIASDLIKSEQDVNLVHYSPQQGLRTIEPKYHGVRGIGAEVRHTSPEHKMSFYYTEGTQPEDIVMSGARSKYTTRLGDKRVYDIATDPEGVISAAKEKTNEKSINRGVFTHDDMHHAIKSAGYHGFKNSSLGSQMGNVIAMYHPMEVTEHTLDFGKNENDLNKGSLQGRMGNPKKYVTGEEAVRVGGWVTEQSEVRENIPAASPEAKQRFFHKLHSQTEVRKHPKTGERMFLMHRGVSGDVENNISHEDNMTSWTPKFDQASSFSRWKNGTVHSAWIPESQVHNYTNNTIGHPEADEHQSDYRVEHEYLIHPHQFIYAKKQKIQPSQILDKKINDKQQVSSGQKRSLRTDFTNELVDYINKIPIREKKLAASEKNTNVDLEKGFKSALAGAGLVASLAMSPANAPETKERTEVSAEKPNHKEISAFGSKPEDHFLHNVMQVETSGGTNLDHPELKHGIHKGSSAVGKFALMPNTIKEVAKRYKSQGMSHPDVDAIHGMDVSQVGDYVSKNPKAELEIARTLARHVIGRHGNNEKAAYAWKYGHNIKADQIDPHKLKNDDYTRKFAVLNSGRSIENLTPASSVFGGRNVAGVEKNELIIKMDEPSFIIKEHELVKNMPRITVPNQAGISSRPDQQVYPVSMASGKEVDDNSSYGKRKSKVDLLAGNTKQYTPPKTNYLQQKIKSAHLNEKYQNFSDSEAEESSRRTGQSLKNNGPTKGVFIPNAKGNHTAYAGGENSRGTMEHEGFHLLSQQILDKHGEDKHKDFLNSLVDKIHPQVFVTMHNTLQRNPNYKAMSESPDHKYRTAYLEEIINAVRDWSTKPDYRSQIKKLHNVDENGKSLMNNPFHESEYRDFDSRLKNSWKNVVNHAKAYNFNAQKDNSVQPLAASELTIQDLNKSINGDWKNEGYKLKTKKIKDGYRVDAVGPNKEKAGHLVYSERPSSSDHLRAHVGHVDEIHRGKGLYQSMIQHAADHAKSLGHKGLSSDGFQRSSDASRAWSKVKNDEKDSGYAVSVGVKQEDGSFKEEKRHKPSIDYFLNKAEGDVPSQPTVQPPTAQPATSKPHKLIQAMDKYASSRGIAHSPVGKVTVNPIHGATIANAYDQMQHDPDHPEVQAAYNALAKETKDQLKHLMSNGLKVSRITPEMENPYKSSKDLHKDLESNNHMWYFPTDQGFGSGKDINNHPMMNASGMKHGERSLLNNDVFRIVHDVAGHFYGGKSGFGPSGEHQAYLTHRQLYSPLAAKALASETMGQNNYVNFSKEWGDHNRKNPSQTHYADQKAGLLPDHILNEEWHK